MNIYSLFTACTSIIAHKSVIVQYFTPFFYLFVNIFGKSPRTFGCIATGISAKNYYNFNNAFVLDLNAFFVYNIFRFIH